MLSLNGPIEDWQSFLTNPVVMENKLSTGTEDACGLERKRVSLLKVRTCFRTMLPEYDQRRHFFIIG
jgi:hypothetical protein